MTVSLAGESTRQSIKLINMCAGHGTRTSNCAPYTAPLMGWVNDTKIFRIQCSGQTRKLVSIYGQDGALLIPGLKV